MVGCHGIPNNIFHARTFSVPPKNMAVEKHARNWATMKWHASFHSRSSETLSPSTNHCQILLTESSELFHSLTGICRVNWSFWSRTHSGRIRAAVPAINFATRAKISCCNIPNLCRYQSDRAQCRSHAASLAVSSCIIVIILTRNATWKTTAF